MKLKSTPVPWTPIPRSGPDYGTTEWWIPGVCFHISKEENASLIAESPEMLKYLIEQAREMWTQEHLDDIGADEMREWMPIPIIERATGMSIEEVLKGE